MQNNNRNAPSSFGILVTLTTPFFYNPAAGNLLMDVRYYQGATPGVAPGPFDASTSSGDTVSRVYTFGVDGVTGTADTGGLITAFVATPVPEPGSVVLLFFGVATLGIFLRRRQRKLGNRRQLRATTN